MAESHDITPHTDMWRNFTRIIGYSTTGIVIVLGLMALFLL